MPWGDNKSLQENWNYNKETRRLKGIRTDIVLTLPNPKVSKKKAKRGRNEFSR